MPKTHTRRPPRRTRQSSAAPARDPLLSIAILLIGGVMVTLTLLGFRSSMLCGAITDGEHACISLVVIGLDGGDVGTGTCIIPGSGGTTGGTTGGGGATSDEDTGETVTDSTIGGGRRYSIPHSQLRMMRLIRAWRSRHRAAPTNTDPLFRDTPRDAWYADDLAEAVRRGFVQLADYFRPSAGATRSETAELLVRMQGGITGLPMLWRAFDDTPASHPRVAYVEEAARYHWMLGYNDCFGTHPCFTHPDAVITRAEAAAMIERVFKLQRTGDAPRFPDNPAGPWYARTIQVAADHCVIQGDARTGLSRPESPVTRAELVVMALRGLRDLSYGTDCVRTVRYDSTPWELTRLTGPSAPITSHPAAFLLPAARPTADDICQLPTLSCIGEAAVHDARVIIQSVLGGMLSLPGADALRAAPPSEAVLWIIGLLWIGIIARVFYVSVNHS